MFRVRKYVTVLMTVLVLLSGVCCVEFVNKSIIEESASHLEEICTQVNTSFIALASNHWKVLDDWKYHIAHTSGKSEEALRDFLRNGKDNWNFTDFYFIGEDGSYRSFLGGEGFLDFGSQWETLMREKEKIVAEGVLPDGSALTVFAIPAEGAAYRGLEYSAIAVGYNSDDLGKVLNLPVFDKQAEYFVVHPDGKVLYATAISDRGDSGNGSVVEDSNDIGDSHHDGNSQFPNFLDDLDGNAKFLDSSLEQLCADFAAGEAGVVRFEAKGKVCYMAYQPVGLQDWMALFVVPEYFVNTGMRRVQLAAAIVFMVFFIIMGTAELCYLVYRRKKAMLGKDVELRYREKLFDMLTSNVDDIFIMFSSDDFSVEYVSPNIDRLLGITVGEVKRDLRVLAAAATEPSNIPVEETIKGIVMGDSWKGEGGFIQRQTGRQRWYRQTLHHASVENTDKFILILSDRTKERQVNQQLQQALDIAEGANKAKSNFLANMSHDMRTPMNAIIGFTTLLDKDAKQPDRVREYAQKIMASSNHLLGLINNVLDMGKIESGKTALNLSEFDFAAMLEELKAVMLPQARAKEQKFSIHTYGLYQELFIGDKARIAQILMNLLNNAVQYTPEKGEIELHIYNREQISNDYAMLRFEVRDTGIGMSREFREKLFEPFTREANTTFCGIQGAGLGLAITKNLVDLMGGTIFVESVQGVGSVFTVDLELRISKRPEGGDFWKKHGIYSMLVVDGEEEVCAGIEKLMAGTSVYVQHAPDGHTALDMIDKKQKQRNPYSLILLAWKLPEMDGMETARRIREKIGNRTPVFALTEYDWSEVEEDAKKAGIHAFLQKPFLISNFRQVVVQLHNGSGYGREEEKEPAGCERTLSKMNFLVAEDNIINAEIISELLKIEGAGCDIAENGKVAMEMFEKSKPGHYHMILMDIQMPVMDGYEAAQGIRGCAHPEAKTIPIAAMTANAFSEDVQKSMAAGMNAHISKPVNMDVLKTTVFELLKKF